MSDENKENIEQKQEKQKIWNKILSLFSIGNLKKIWQKIWGKDLPEDITEIFPDDKSKSDINVNLYNKLKRKLAVKRFFVSLAIIICSYIVLNFLFNGIISTIKNNPAIACRNKPVCIYSGKKIRVDNKATKRIIESFNGYIFIITETINYKTKKSKFLFQIYNIKKNRIIKTLVNNNETFSYTRAIPISENEILFFSDNKNNSNIIYIYNINKNIFEQRKIDILKDSYMLTNYNNGILFTTNNSYAKNYFYGYLKDDNNLSKEESLFYLNFANLQIEKFPNFAKQPKYLPQREDILTLDNGKIIIPIRINDNSLFYAAEKRYSIWDHIELYIPEENKFIAIKDTKPLDNNLFNIKLKNGDILFINLDSTYIFKNNENKFVYASVEETIKNKDLVYRLSSTLDYVMGERITNLLLNKHKFIKIDNDKYLIACGNGVEFEKDYLCNKTVYFDYSSSTVSEGPKFIYPHRNSKIIKDENNKNKLIVVGGSKYIKRDYEIEEIINKRMQIIEKK